MLQLIWTIARRYLVARKSHNLINLITFISGVGVAVGTFALIVVLSVFNGFDRVITAMVNTVSPDLLVEPGKGKVMWADAALLEATARIRGVAGVSRILEEDALFVYGSKQHLGRIKGVEAYYQQSGRFDSISQHNQFMLLANDTPYAMAGSGVAWFLGMQPGQNTNPLLVYVPRRGDPSRFSPDQGFSSMSISVAGVFAAQQDFDSRYVFVPYEWAAQLLEYDNESSGIEIFVNGTVAPNRLREQLKSIWGADVIIKDRYEQQETLYRIMRTEKWAIYIILTFILFMATFNVVGSLTMIIVDKQKDSNVLRFLGMPVIAIRTLFMLEGLLIALAGAMTGLFFGVVVVAAQERFGLLKLGGQEGAFVIDAYPAELRFGDVTAVLLTVVAIGLLASAYAVAFALQGRKINPVYFKN